MSAHRPTETVDLPQLGKLYGRAALGAVTAKLSSNGRLAALPSKALVAQHPGMSPRQADQYRRLFGGEAFDGVHRRSLPSVLIHIMSFPMQVGLMSDEAFPMPLLGMVHLSNEVEHRRPIEIDQPVTIRVWAENLRPHRRGTQTDIVTEVLPFGADTSQTAEQDVLWRGVSTYLGRGVYLAGKPEAAEPARSGSRDFTPPAKSAVWRLGADAGRRYAALSGDYNPIHLGSLSAKLLGMDSAIVHGMYSAARMLEGREPEDAGHRWSITFAAPVKLPGTVAFGIQQPDERTLRLAGWNPRRGRPHFEGELHLP